MRGRYEIEQEVNEALRTLTDDGIRPDTTKLLVLLLEAVLDVRDMYRKGYRPGIEA